MERAYRHTIDESLSDMDRAVDRLFTMFVVGGYKSMYLGPARIDRVDDYWCVHHSDGIDEKLYSLRTAIRSLLSSAALVTITLEK